MRAERELAMSRHPAGKGSVLYYADEIVYLDCTNSKCPAHRIGYKHAHKAEGVSDASSPVQGDEQETAGVAGPLSGVGE